MGNHVIYCNDYISFVAFALKISYNGGDMVANDYVFLLFYGVMFGYPLYYAYSYYIKTGKVYEGEEVAERYFRINHDRKQRRGIE